MTRNVSHRLRNLSIHESSKRTARPQSMLSDAAEMTWFAQR